MESVTKSDYFTPTSIAYTEEINTEEFIFRCMYPKVNESDIEGASSNFLDYEADFDFETESSVHSKVDCSVSYSDSEDSIYSGPLMGPNSSTSQEFVISTFESPIKNEFQQEIQAASNYPTLDSIQSESETSILEIAINVNVVLNKPVKRLPTPSNRYT